ncbi:hypothetical protein CNX70_00090 [Janthinobacterium svalbardensis]|uniref:Uncharacterized protein n=1 Tax=Janthinobacterium svalbardensis TaxID=368607 RepID=A0A290WQ55_9BURK|nr:hypothetical protein CNX70_00090 [Janthinobacterium svalbardensis]
MPGHAGRMTASARWAGQFFIVQDKIRSMERDWRLGEGGRLIIVRSEIQGNRVEVSCTFNFLIARYRERLPVATSNRNFHAL